MTHAARIAFGLIVTLGLCGASEAADWKDIKPQRTKETEVVAEFGAPDEIIATFPWSEWSARWKIRPRTTDYILRYRSDPARSALLVGPGGRADDAEVRVSDSTVLSVTWHYGGPSARAAAALLRADPELHLNSPESMSQGSKAGPGGVVFVELLGRSDSTVRVSYELK